MPGTTNSLPGDVPLEMSKRAPGIHRVAPNETWQLVIEFAGSEHRLFNASIAREDLGWTQLAYPRTFKHLTYTEQHVAWPQVGELPASYLYEHSVPLTAERRENQLLRLSYKNQAPTTEHPSHHVYDVHVYPFSTRLFGVGQSIGGGHAEMGGSRRVTVDQLLAMPQWEQHFVLAGGEWAIPAIRKYDGHVAALSHLLVQEICRREGL
ncbi:hypothetical protein [Dyella sp.]|uniref:hypothetical protein n=1 Tax=Dyella sp. TaxID=1869338 RepID=UPI002ECFFAFF